MKPTHYDTWEFKQILNLAEANPNEVKRKFEDYLNKYPNDYSAQMHYSFLLIKLGLLDISQEIINEAEESFYNNTNYSNKEQNRQIFNNLLIKAKLKLLAYQKNICNYIVSM